MKEYEEYVEALGILRQAPEQDLDNEFVRQGVIVKFALQYELGCRLLKTLLASQEDAAAAVRTKRGVIRSAWWSYDFVDEEVWLSMGRDADDKTHITDPEAAESIVKSVVETYLPAFDLVREGLEARYGELLLE